MAAGPGGLEKIPTMQRGINSSSTRIRCITTSSLLLQLYLLAIVASTCTALYGRSRLRRPKVGSGIYSKAAVASDAGVCSKIGVDILKKGGGAIDAAISSLLCAGVVNLHSTGIGGGGFLVFFEAASQQLHALDYREVAPLAAEYNMYDGLGPTASTIGGLSVAVPAELRGLELAWKKWGRLKWQELFLPVIELARNGFPVSSAISKAIDLRKDYITQEDFPGLYELLAPNGKFLKENDTLKRPLYADTLEMISWNGASWFYESEFMKEMVEELKEYDSILSEQDFREYTAVQRRVTESWYSGHSVRGVTAPGSGAVLGLILNVLDRYKFNSGDFGDLSHHRIVEAFKFAYSQRLRLGDPVFNDTIRDATDFMLDLNIAKEMFSRITDDITQDQDYYMQPFDFPATTARGHGTSHLSVLAENGDAVAATSTINLYFGSLIRSRKSGVIFNDEMDDFSFPSRGNAGNYKQTGINYIEPGKRPLSSMTPTIILDSDKVRMILGASGGFKITTAVAQVIVNVLGFRKSLPYSIALPRLHHQLFPNYITSEITVIDNTCTLAALRAKGHKIVMGPGAVVQGILIDNNGTIYATSDTRKGGHPAGY